MGMTHLFSIGLRIYSVFISDEIIMNNNNKSDLLKAELTLKVRKF